MAGTRPARHAMHSTAERAAAADACYEDGAQLSLAAANGRGDQQDGSCEAEDVFARQLKELQQGRLCEEDLRVALKRRDLSAVLEAQLHVNSQRQALEDLGLMLPSIRSLTLDGSIVSTIRELGTGLRQLRLLSLVSCRLDDLEGISAIPWLETLILRDNCVSDMTPLAMHENLRVLDLSRNCIDDLVSLRVLGSCPQLQCLDLSRNPVAAEADYRGVAGHVVPSLRVLDGKEIIVSEVRKVADRLLLREEELEDEARMDADLVSCMEVIHSSTSTDKLDAADGDPSLSRKARGPGAPLPMDGDPVVGQTGTHRMTSSSDDALLSGPPHAFTSTAPAASAIRKADTHLPDNGSILTHGTEFVFAGAMASAMRRKRREDALLHERPCSAGDAAVEESAGDRSPLYEAFSEHPLRLDVRNSHDEGRLALDDGAHRPKTSCGRRPRTPQSCRKDPTLSSAPLSSSSSATSLSPRASGNMSPRASFPLGPASAATSPSGAAHSPGRTCTFKISVASSSASSSIGARSGMPHPEDLLKRIQRPVHAHTSRRQRMHEQSSTLVYSTPREDDASPSKLSDSSSDDTGSSRDRAAAGDADTLTAVGNKMGRVGSRATAMQRGGLDDSPCDQVAIPVEYRHRRKTSGKAVTPPLSLHSPGTPTRPTGRASPHTIPPHLSSAEKASRALGFDLRSSLAAIDAWADDGDDDENGDDDGDNDDENNGRRS